MGTILMAWLSGLSHLVRHMVAETSRTVSIGMGLVGRFLVRGEEAMGGSRSSGPCRSASWP